MTHTGSCHCGQIKFTAEGDPSKVMECNCSHCSRKGYLLWFIPRDKFQMPPQTTLSTYTFNKHVIQHHFCPTCGCAPFGFGTDKTGAPTVAINVRCLEGIELSTLTRIPVDGRKF